MPWVALYSKSARFDFLSGPPSYSLESVVYESESSFCFPPTLSQMPDKGGGHPAGAWRPWATCQNNSGWASSHSIMGGSWPKPGPPPAVAATGALERASPRETKARRLPRPHRLDLSTKTLGTHCSCNSAFDVFGRTEPNPRPNPVS